MANIDVFWPFVRSFEGGFVNDPADSGGATNRGVTIATWKKQGYDKDGDGDIDVQDLRLITDEDAKRIMKANYWDRWKADAIIDQSIANILVDWVWGSGAYGIKIPQKLLGVTIDGIVGPKTIAAVNAQNPVVFFEKLKKERADYFERICVTNPKNRKFLNGWMRRLNSIRYGSLILNDRKSTIVRF